MNKWQLNMIYLKVISIKELFLTEKIWMFSKIESKFHSKNNCI